MNTKRFPQHARTLPGFTKVAYAEISLKENFDGARIHYDQKRAGTLRA